MSGFYMLREFVTGQNAQADKDLKFNISDHTDNTGKPEKNQVLSGPLAD
jgi:outer membrane protein OmpA-like peptidoglycan-associated protein